MSKMLSETIKRRPSKVLVESLVKNCGVKLLALDFDRTIVSVHTAGYWQGGVENLVQYVRPCFRKLIRAALKSSLHVAVVTFSMQVDLIREVLRAVLPPESDTSRIIIRGGSGAPQPAGSGKEPHLAAVLRDLSTRHQSPVNIQPEQILLIDDDEENVAIAKRHRHRVYHVCDDVTMRDIDAFVGSLEKDVWTQYG